VNFAARRSSYWFFLAAFVVALLSFVIVGVSAGLVLHRLSVAAKLATTRGQAVSQLARRVVVFLSVALAGMAVLVVLSFVDPTALDSFAGFFAVFQVLPILMIVAVNLSLILFLRLGEDQRKHSASQLELRKPLLETDSTATAGYGEDNSGL
jgi:hypothetical protein